MFCIIYVMKRDTFKEANKHFSLHSHQYSFESLRSFGNNTDVPTLADG